MRTPVLLAVCALLAGCAAVPKVDDTPTAGGPQIMGARGPLTTGQSRALLDKIAPEPGDAGILKRHLAIEEAVAETPLVAGNSTGLLVDGPTPLRPCSPPSERQIDHQPGILHLRGRRDRVASSSGDLLIAKRQQGVAVNILYDSYGSNATKPDVFDRLKDAGIKVVEFNPVNPLNPITLNKRDHRKMLVADGARAIVGGINLSSTYRSSGRENPAAWKSKPGQHWRDTDLEIDGPVVAQLQTLVSRTLVRAEGSAAGPGPNIFPPFRPRAAKWCGSSAARPTRRFLVITSRFCRPSATPRRMSG